MCLKKLWVYLKEYKTESILAPLFKLLEVVFDLLVPVVVAKIIDIGIANNDHGYIVKMFLVLIVLAAVLPHSILLQERVSAVQPI